MITIRKIESSEAKSAICKAVLSSLPNWFGDKAAIEAYAVKCRELPVFAAFEAESLVGFVALKEHNPYTAEIYVMGLRTAYHHRGIGKQLVQVCEQFCLDNKREFLTVKTLDGSMESEAYARTRKFYDAMGFRPLEVFTQLWGKDNPCLFLVKCLVCE